MHNKIRNAKRGGAGEDRRQKLIFKVYARPYSFENNRVAYKLTKLIFKYTFLF